MHEQALKVTINDASETRIIGAPEPDAVGPKPDPQPAEEPAPKIKGGK